MIRRSSSKSGEERWILISQVEHARLSGVLADAWGAPPFAPLVPHDQMVAAIELHDDGWSAWEVAPKVDGQTGRPLDFTETPLTDSLSIWRDSIRAGADIGPLAAYMVSGHFAALLERFSARWTSDATLAALANDFLVEQHDERERWLAMWQKTSGGIATSAEADRAVGWLQMFDFVSLWLCCAERSEPEQFAPPVGPRLTMRPAHGVYDLEVSPWPFCRPALELEALGRSVPVARYANPSDLVTAPAEAVTLHWLLRPESAGERKA
jgi:hypothetical protein